MTKRIPFWALGAWSIVGVPAIFGTFVFVAYQTALAFGHLPFLSTFGEALWFGVFGLCVLSGTLAIVYLPFPKWLRAAVGVIYVPVMSGSLLLVALWVACANGDCL